MLLRPTETSSFMFRGLTSTALRRPRRLWDMHIPQTADLAITDMGLLPPRHHFGTRTRNWVSIPDANLPEPWTCNWAAADWTADLVRPLEATLAQRYTLSNVPLTPVMFNSAKEATVFGCADSGKFFLHNKEWFRSWASYPPRACEGPQLSAFEGVFPSVEVFIERADWNRVQRMEPAIGTKRIPHNRRGTIKRTLWDMCPPPGTLGYIPRELPDGGEFNVSKYPRLSEWPRTPDTALPEPWSAHWPAFLRTYHWYSEVQVELEERSGGALVGLVPALFEPADDYAEDTVLCPPGGAGTYYLWGSALRGEMNWRAPMPEMHRFRGVFASVEHFVRTADWNSLEEVVKCNEGYSS
ncbi:hypothetical protein B0H16DRAFT_1758986 [Mycena metata]|uniref:Uncharacterized protein n=1 Tax=Mycena metata TaxID=1033252 RepID=A0AAD7MZU7_9AGAR|nr:hypothetical protein B0H16DRAFT_1758986 [Mycena metata]